MPAPSSSRHRGKPARSRPRSRPDLADALRLALEAADGVDDAVAWLEALRTDAPSSYDALVTVVVAGYYMHPDVMRRLGYPGQVPQQVSVDRFPDYMEEGLLERVYERGDLPPDAAGGRGRRRVTRGHCRSRGRRARRLWPAAGSAPLRWPRRIEMGCPWRATCDHGSAARSTRRQSLLLACRDSPRGAPSLPRAERSRPVWGRLRAVAG
jgi:hypothetical protein